MTHIAAPPHLDALTQQIIGCGIAVHRTPGPGLLESVYRECLCVELEAAGLGFAIETRVPIVYRQRPIRTYLRIDLIVEDLVVVEIKAVDKIHPVHKVQVITYLKLSRRPAGLLMNFNAVTLLEGLHRQNHPDIHAQVRAAAKSSQPGQG